MKNQSALSNQFQRKISTFCDVLIAPLVSPRELNNIRPYLLIIHRKYPPTRSGRTDWLSIQAACGLESVMSSALKKALQSGLEAIVRWIDKDQSEQENGLSTTKAADGARRAKGQNNPKSSEATRRNRAKTDVPPKSIDEFRSLCSTHWEIRSNSLQP